MSWSRRIPFKVDIGGIIDIMGRSLYSRPDTPIRETIQNAHDAIMRRRQSELTFQGRIDIIQDAAAGTLSIRDNGVGLAPSEAEEYLGTLGIGLTGMIKRGELGQATDRGDLIGQFGIGLFSAFMIARRVVVESLRVDGEEAVRWEAGDGIEMVISSCNRTVPGTEVTLHLKPECRFLAERPEAIEAAIKEYADFLPVPIFLNDGKTRVNVINVAWFEATPEQEATELELEGYFHETPLDVLPLRMETPVVLNGALYVTPQRTPGFSGEPVLTVTVRRMVISRRIQGLLPGWASFIRGVLEINGCSPTASREDLVRDERFERARLVIEERLYEHFEKLAKDEPARWQSILAWHRYTLAGTALEYPRLRALLRRTYPLPTSRGPLTFDEIAKQSAADPIFESEADRVIWYNGERVQENWVNTLFADADVPCVHALRSFEESLLAAWVADDNSSGTITDLRPANPGSQNFAEVILGVQELSDAPTDWTEFLSSSGAQVRIAEFRTSQPVLAFLNERHELWRTFDEMKKTSQIPSGFQRLIDTHFERAPAGKNEILLNANHRLVKHVLQQKTSHPLASVLRILVNQALTQAGAVLPRAAHECQLEDLDWIADALWNRK